MRSDFVWQGVVHEKMICRIERHNKKNHKANS